MTIKLEHVALNVPDVNSLVDWYVRHLGFCIFRREPVEPFKTFLCDAVGAVMLELYTNREADVPRYTEQHPTIFHLGFRVAKAEIEQGRLESAGAKFVSRMTTRDGAILIMMKDPWGISLQLCERGRN